MSAPSFSITLEEHAVFPSLGSDHPFHSGITKLFPHAQVALEDHSTGRIADMDKGHISFQVISHLPGMSNFNPESCRKANDEMAAAIRKHPSRLGGFAALPMAYPDKAAAELGRCVKELGLLGAMIDSHLGDMTNYDDERFWPVFETAERLDVPIYIHPAPPPDFVKKGLYSGNYSPAIEKALAGGCWGWHQDVGLHILKLYSAGLFSRFAHLKLIIGHVGELLPMMIDRMDKVPFFNNTGNRPFSEVWDRNIWVTTSNVFSVRVLEMLMKVTKKDRVLYSIDTPFNLNHEGLVYLQELAEKGTLSKEELDMFAFGNAKKLLKLDIPLKQF